MDGLTFMQLALISLFLDATRFAELPAEGYEEKEIGFELLNALAATFELYQNGIVRLWKPGDKSGEVILDIGEVRPAHMRLSSTGQRLFNLAGLAAIADSNELERLADLFAAAAPVAEKVVLGEAAALPNK